MKRHRQNVLKNELRAAGATTIEASELASLADDLRFLRRADKQTYHKDRSRKGLLLTALSMCALAGIVVGVCLVAFVQTALPGSWLFPVQTTADDIAMTLHSQYRETVMMKRADQVKELVSKHASSQSDINALNGYMKVADKYKNEPYANYTAFQYCKSQLAQAAKMAPPQVSRAIQRSLDSLDVT